MDDVTLIRETIEGRVESFAALVERHQGALHALVSFELGDARAAAEVVQAVFASACDHLEDFRFTIGFRSWLCEIALHELRSGRSRRRSFGARGLDGLPARRRRVLSLRVFADLPFREIARIEGTSVAAAKVAYHQAVAATDSPRRLAGWRCRRFRTSLVDLLEGTLEGTAFARLERHLEACARCGERKERLRDVPARLRAGTPIPDDALLARERQDIVERSSERAAAVRRPAPRAPVRAFPTSAALAAALAVVIAVIGALRFRETFRPGIQIAGGGKPVPNDLAALDDETLLTLAEIAAVLTPGGSPAPGIEELSLSDLEALDRWLGASCYRDETPRFSRITAPEAHDGTEEVRG